MRLDIIGNGMTAPLLRMVCVSIAAAGLMLGGCSSGVNTTGECYYTSKSMQHSLPACETFNLNVNTKEGNRFDIYFQIPYSRIHFEKDFDVFTASYTASFVLRDESGSVVRANDVDRTVVAQSYAETSSSLHDAFLKMFFVPPGDYLLEILVVDNRSHLSFRRRERIEVESFSKDDFGAGDYLLFEDSRSEQHGVSLTPLFPSRLSYVRDSIGMFQELYNLRRGDTVQLSLLYMMPSGRDTADTKFVSILPPYNLRMTSCMSPPDSLYYRYDSTFVSGVDGVLQIFQYFPKLAVGVTTVTRKVFHRRNGVADSSVSTGKFSVYRPSFPSLKGVDEEIAALSYIAWPQEVDSLRAGATLSDRLRRVQIFWGDHGGTVRRKEFYNRIEEANLLFSSCIEGWRTPMGISYIVCGAPDYVECQGLSNEVWYYDIGSNRSFTIPFREIYPGSSERYFEIAPYSVNDFVWSEFVNRWRRQ